MSALNDMLDFYMEGGWAKNDAGVLVPSPELLADQGKKARRYKHPSEAGAPPENIVQANYLISLAELSDALRDVALCANMLPSEHRNMGIGSACVKMQNAEYRLRLVTRS
jgi:hypothetical protein